MGKPESHDAYVATAPEPLRAVLTRLRAQLALALPDADEVIKYDMSGFEIGGTIIEGYAAFSKQCGLYVDPRAIAEHAEALSAAGLKATNTGVTFTPTRPLADDLVRALAISSRRHNGL